MRIFVASTALSLLVISSGGCKPREAAETSSVKASENSGGLVNKLNPRYARNKDQPWVDWQWYVGARDDRGAPNTLKVAGIGRSLAELDGVRVAMLQNNPVDTNGASDQKTPDLVEGRKVWRAMQTDNPKECGERDHGNRKYMSRTLDGMCNDFDNPLMGSQFQRFGRNVKMETVNAAITDFNEGNGLLNPNPKEVATKLMHRKDPEDHAAAPFFNLWAAAWIQFMTHDWFAHTMNFKGDDEKLNIPGAPPLPRTPNDDQKGLEGKGPVPKKTWRNQVSAWWDASQLYGHDKESQDAVRDPQDRAKLKVAPNKLLPVETHMFGNEQRQQEVAGFRDNWWVGLSLLHTLFSMEHNRLVDLLRQKETPPSGAEKWSDDEVYDVARLMISATIAKIHTIEWTPQLLFNAIGDISLNANWNGLLGKRPSLNNNKLVQVIREQIRERVRDELQGAIERLKQGNTQLSQFIQEQGGVDGPTIGALVAAGPGIVGQERAEHFGTPFTLPEEFTSVYRLHAMVPDRIPMYSSKTFKRMSAQDISARGFTPSSTGKLDIHDTLRDNSANAMKKFGFDTWAMTFGMNGCGQLTAHNFPQFLADLSIPGGGKLDMAMVDITRDRERGVPRFNEFRRQMLLDPLKSFDDFIDHELETEIQTKRSRDISKKVSLVASAAGLKGPELTADEIAAKKAELKRQQDFVALMKQVYDNDIEKVDLQVGIYAEFARPHGYVISETQFQVFILNASRRLFSDRFFTESYTPEFYTKTGIAYVDGITFTDILRTHLPELKSVLAGVENAFDVWDRQRLEYALSTGRRPDFPDGAQGNDAPAAVVNEAHAAPDTSMGEIPAPTNADSN